MGTITGHLNLQEGDLINIEYDDGDKEVLETWTAGYKYVRGINELKEYVTAAYVSNKASRSDLRRNLQSSNKRQKTGRGTGSCATFYAGLDDNDDDDDE